MENIKKYFYIFYFLCINYLSINFIKATHIKLIQKGKTENFDDFIKNNNKKLDDLDDLQLEISNLNTDNYISDVIFEFKEKKIAIIKKNGKTKEQTMIDCVMNVDYNSSNNPDVKKKYTTEISFGKNYNLTVNKSNFLHFFLTTLPNNDWFREAIKTKKNLNYIVKNHFAKPFELFSEPLFGCSSKLYNMMVNMFLN